MLAQTPGVMEVAGGGGSWLYFEGGANRVGPWLDSDVKKGEREASGMTAGFLGITLVLHVCLPMAT